MAAQIKVVYVAGPYTGKTPEEVDANIDRARELAIKVCNDKGWMPLTPHLNTGTIGTMCRNASESFWIAAYLRILGSTDAVVLVPGWENSPGTLLEIEEAKRKGIPVFEDYQALPHADDFTQHKLEL